SQYVSEVRRPTRIDDGIYTGLDVGPLRCDGVGVFREWGGSRFTTDDRELVRMFHQEVLGRFARPDGNLSSVRLSPRERETLLALLGGARRKEIARRMGVSLHTVNDYVKSLYRRLGVSGLPELYRFAQAERRAPRSR